MRIDSASSAASSCRKNSPQEAPIRKHFHPDKSLVLHLAADPNFRFSIHAFPFTIRCATDADVV
jgi:hypothetical protein